MTVPTSPQSDASKLANLALPLSHPTSASGAIRAFAEEWKPIKIAVAVSPCWLSVTFTPELVALALRGARTRHGARATIH